MIKDPSSRPFVEVRLAGDAGQQWSVWSLEDLAILGEVGREFVRHIADGKRAEFFHTDGRAVLAVRLSDELPEHFELLDQMADQGRTCFLRPADVRQLEVNAVVFNSPLSTAPRLDRDQGLELLDRQMGLKPERHSAPEPN